MGCCAANAAVRGETNAKDANLVSSQASVRSRYITERPLEADYVVDRSQIVGTGMNGPITLAVGKCDGCKYAVKRFPKTNLHRRALANIRNEAKIYLSLDHPHVARLEAVYESESELHFVMEYLEGGELYKRVKGKKGFCEDTAARAAHQILLAVAYLHEHGIAHRDLKLENFVYERKNGDHLKLIDFGLSKFVRENETMYEACGTTCYMAPEVLSQSYTKQADAWSLGVVVYMMLTERMLFSGTKAEIFSKIQRGKLELSSRFHKLSEPARDFVNSLLTMNPADRATPRQALDHPWLRSRAQTHRACPEPRLLHGFRSFARASQCQRKVWSLMAWSLSTEDRAAVRQQFLAMDFERKGSVSFQDFKSALGGYLESDDEAMDLFKGLDSDGNARIEYSEFLAAAMASSAEFQGSALRRAFARLDRNGDGSISRSELMSMLGDSCSVAEIEDFLREADSSGDGQLCLDEFAAYVRKVEWV